MRDHVTEELISAYVDGELEGDELKLVEDLLTESAEHRQLLAEFQAMRASIWALPSFHLPADFHTRVVGQIDELKVSPAKEPVRRNGRGSKALPWGNVLFAAASLAAVLAVTVMLRPPHSTTVVSGPPQARTTPRVMPVYLRQEPKMVMVYDVTVTQEGWNDKVIDKLLQNLGIGIDPALRLNGKLERELAAFRSPPGLEDQAQVVPYKEGNAPKPAREEVEMIYVASNITALSQFYLDLEQMEQAGDKVSHIHPDLVVEPNKLGVMHRLHRSAREHFTHNMDAIPSDIGQAFRLSFHIELKSVSVPGLAMLPVPTIRTQRKLEDLDRVALELDDVAGAVAPPLVPGVRDGSRVTSKMDELREMEMQPGYILLILRHTGANAGDQN